MSIRPTAILRHAALAALVATSTVAASGEVLAQRGPSQQAPVQQPSIQQGPIQQGPTIAAIVNEQLISTYDLQARLRLALFSANLPDTQESRQRLLPQVLRQLVDEQLQMQEAQRLGLTVSEKELADAQATIERQNNLPPGGLPQHLAQGGVPFETLRAQLRASIAWGKIVRRQIRPQVEVGEEEVDDYLRDLRARGGRTEYDAAEIFLSAEVFDSVEAARQAAERLAIQARGGAAFGALAQQFSQAPSAANGGALGKVQEGQLDPRLEAALATMQPGQISDPVPVENGFYILQLNEKRRIEHGAGGPETVSLRRVFLPVAPGAAAEVVAEQEAAASRISNTARSCADMERLGREAGSRGNMNPGPIPLSELPQQLRDIVAPLPLNRPTPPLRLDDGFLVMMVCARSVGDTAGLPSRDEVMQSLGMQRIDMMARRYLRDLRRSAFIDVRL